MLYGFATNQIQDETAKGINRQTTAWISHDLTRNNKLAFSSTTNLQFYRFSNTEIVLFLFQLMYKQRIDMNDISRKIIFVEENHCFTGKTQEKRPGKDCKTERKKIQKRDPDPFK